MTDRPKDILPLEVAVKVAGSLTVAGHPRNQDAINATAMQLIRLCKGCQINGQSWNPEQQAEELVRLVTEEWGDGWPERGGSKRLQDLYRSKFIPEVLPPNPAQPLGEKLPINCSKCNDFGIVGEVGKKVYCDCPEGEYCRAEFGERWLAIVSGPKPRPRDERNVSVPFTDVDRRFRESQSVIQAQIQDAEATLKDLESTRERKEIAQMMIDAFAFKSPKKAKARNRSSTSTPSPGRRKRCVREIDTKAGQRPSARSFAGISQASERG